MFFDDETAAEYKLWVNASQKDIMYAHVPMACDLSECPSSQYPIYTVT